MDMAARRVGVGWSGRRLLNPALSSARSSAQRTRRRGAPGRQRDAGPRVRARGAAAQAVGADARQVAAVEAVGR